MSICEISGLVIANFFQPLTKAINRYAYYSLQVTEAVVDRLNPLEIDAELAHSLVDPLSCSDLKPSKECPQFKRFLL